MVVVGNGMAAVRTVEHLIELAPALYDTTILDAEPHGNSNRILLSPVLAGEQTVANIILNDVDWYAAHGIMLHLGKQVTRIDRVRRRVEAEDGTVAEYPPRAAGRVSSRCSTNRRWTGRPPAFRSVSRPAACATSECPAESLAML